MEEATRYIVNSWVYVNIHRISKKKIIDGLLAMPEAMCPISKYMFLLCSLDNHLSCVYPTLVNAGAYL
jgi:hypothetical protein